MAIDYAEQEHRRRWVELQREVTVWAMRCAEREHQLAEARARIDNLCVRLSNANSEIEHLKKGERRNG